MSRDLLGFSGNLDAASLHARVSADLARNLRGSVIGESESPGADLIIKQGNRIAVIEVKTGDPGLPLPSSASAQMQLLARHARQRFEPEGVQEVLPVLVTNYKISPADQQELENEGIKVVPFTSISSLNDAKRLSNLLVQIVGFDR